MNFESTQITPLELEIQITIENASLETKALKQALKELNPQTKQYKKALEALVKQQQKEWGSLEANIDQHLKEALTYSKGKLESIRNLNEWIAKTVNQQSAKVAEKIPAQPARPIKPRSKA